ncbi:Polyketide cyclase / dehydrase and lipid transport [Marinobacter daqiaonensis]|uniref:Polyketide cyclase / dehydrase and lipid transport n=1 Tax=Marinobacter daqiaonensis TaxID=650891 RepID=A0A1I6JBY4_9GAMM|nr:SRPBCC family protein [Marinobacter daqiaonensis]SFR76452.1 Polyketide cyclase / dehydrase and lipid transport [Marinobacter daqiaonensis]
MPNFRVELTDQLPFPRARVFDLISDHNRLGPLIGLPVKRIRDSDQADPNGIGSVRWLGVGPVGFEETIITFEPDHLIEYTVTSFSAFRNHLGRIRLSELPDIGTRIHYTIEFDEVVPYSGPTLQMALERALRRGLRRLRQTLGEVD